jgi:hypothetical protein
MAAGKNGGTATAAKKSKKPAAGTPTDTPENRLAGKGGADEASPTGVTSKHYSQPYSVLVTLVGTEDVLFHRYDVEQVEAQAKAAKGSKEKKTDNVEAYVHRTAAGAIGLPGINFKACLADAAKSFQDPRSPRKSARDMVRAALKIPGEGTFLNGAGDVAMEWDYIDKRRVQVQRNAISRCRPALHKGWKLSLQINVVDPEYIQPDWLSELLVRAGRSIGLCDYRPDFGTFRIEHFEPIEFRDEV